MRILKTFEKFNENAYSVPLYSISSKELAKELGMNPNTFDNKRGEFFYFELDGLKIPTRVPSLGDDSYDGPEPYMIIFGTRNNEGKAKLQRFLKDIEYEKDFTGRPIINDWQNYFSIQN